MPFTGQLNPSLQLAEGVTEYPINAGQEGTILDIFQPSVNWSGSLNGK